MENPFDHLNTHGLNLKEVWPFSMVFWNGRPKPHTIYKLFSNTSLVMFRDIGPLLREDDLHQEFICRKVSVDVVRIRRFPILFHAPPAVTATQIKQAIF